MSLALLFALAWKSLLVAGAGLALLHLARRRSAGERSRLAHAVLLALLLIPVASLFAPTLDVAPPPLLEPLAVPAAAPALPAGAPVEAATDWLGLALLAPVALLLIGTLIAVLRLQLVRRRADVLEDPAWLQALAAAQRRFGFKHGTALLVSRELSSPISWGVMRPVIVLSEGAAAEPHEADSIVAHELAHVAHLDWAKLIAGRAACALYWFNPLVWLLVRTCHELREAAADDAVLRAGAERADYAALLVSVARHENRGALLAAHGVAPRRGALSRRIHEILDAGRSRTPARAGWTLACLVAALAGGTAVSAVELREKALPAAVARVAAPQPQVVAAQPAAPAPARTEVRKERPRRERPAPALTATADLLGDPRPEVRGSIARALGEAGARGHARSVAALLRDPDAHVRFQAAHALGDLADPAGRPALEEALDDEDPRVRAKAAWALARVAETEAGIND